MLTEHQTMRRIFQKVDIETVCDPLVRLLRLIFYRQKITFDHFLASWLRYGHTQNLPHNTIITRCHNDCKVLDNPRSITFNKFHRLLTEHLDVELVSLQIVVQDPGTGEIVIYGSADPDNLG